MTDMENKRLLFLLFKITILTLPILLFSCKSIAEEKQASDRNYVPDVVAIKIYDKAEPAVIVSNGDDDDGNGVADLNQVGPITGENNLAKLTIDIGNIRYGKITLTKTQNGGKIRVWKTPSKTGEIMFQNNDNVFTAGNIPNLYIEGIEASDTMNDIILTAKHDTLPAKQGVSSQTLTVLWVGINTAK